MRAKSHYRRVAGAPRVMFSFEEPNERANPYVHLLIASLNGRVEIRFFSWRELVIRRPDVLHVHWPETMVRGTRRWKTNIKSLGGIAWLLVRRVTRTRLVWTVHNPSPHESEGWMSTAFCRLLARTCDYRILINAADAAGKFEQSSAVILHGSFREWYGPISSRETRPGRPARLLFFGLIRPYKGVSELYEAFKVASRGAPMTLTVRGAVTEPTLEADLVARARDVPGIDAVFGHIGDDVLKQTVEDSDLVVLPYSRLRNSGAALTALSLGCPVLLPATETAFELQREFGSEWVHLYHGVLGASDLLRACGSLTDESGRDVPDMSRRLWVDAGRAHMDVYDELLGR